MDDPHARAQAAEVQHLALLAEHLLARAAHREAAGAVEDERAAMMREAARRACVRAVAGLSAGTPGFGDPAN